MLIQKPLAALSRLPLLLERLTGVPDAQLRMRPPGDCFSLLEQVCHLRDIEVEGYGRRLALLLEQEHPQLPDLDGAALAKARDYNSQDLAPALAAFIAARAANLARLKSMQEKALARSGHLEKVGEVTVGRLLELWVAHDREHAREIESLLVSLRDPARQPGPSRSMAS